ncbi:MAG: peptidylprolyl isomerase [Porticoccaceae bacterium]|nr:peptidylprolyl isomerase [Porticoccaceae bacterium]
MNPKTPSNDNRSKRYVYRCLAIASLLALGSQSVSSAFAEFQALDRIVAIVNEDVVMSSELEEQVSALIKQMQRGQQQIPARTAIESQMLDKLIQDRLQLDIGKRAGVQISDTELNQALTDTAQKQGLTLDQFVSYAHQDGLTLSKLRQQFKKDMVVARVQQAMVNRRIEITEQEIDNFLSSEEGKFMSSPDVNVGHILIRLSSSATEQVKAEAFAKAEALQRRLTEGEDFKQLALVNSAGPNALKGGDLDWRKTTQLPALFTQALDQLEPGQVSETLHSDAGLHLLKLYERRGGGEQLIEQTEVRHILLKTNEIRTEDQTRKLIASLREQALANDNFASLARQHSDDTGSALKGGNLGWSMPGQFVPEFEKAISELEIGTISEPILTQFGWHIIEVTGHRKQDFSSEILRNQATNQLRQRKYAEELQVWMEEIRTEAFIDIKS